MRVIISGERKAIVMTSISTSGSSSVNPVKLTDLESLYKAADTRSAASGGSGADGKLSASELKTYLNGQREHGRQLYMMSNVCRMFFGNQFDGYFTSEMDRTLGRIKTAETVNQFIETAKKDLPAGQASGFALSLDLLKGAASFDGASTDISSKDLGHLSNQVFVNSQYQQWLGREAEAGGLTFWTKLIDDGKSKADITAGIKGSPERKTFFVKEQYRTLLGREAEPAGLAGWVELLNQGKTEADIIAGIKGSAEYMQKHPAA